MILFFSFSVDFIFNSSFRFIAKLSRNYGEFLYTLPHSYLPLLSTSHTTQYIFLPLLDLNWHIIITQVHSLEDTLGIEHSMGFDKCIMTCNKYYNIIQNSLTALKILCALPIYLPPLDPHNHLSFYCLHSFAFFRMSYS